MTSKKLCALCGNYPPIKNSHIVPNSIGRWLKETSVTGKMRQSNNPNKRVQDTLKIELLCQNCENIFSEHEKYFCERIFKPVIQGDSPVIEYGPSLLRFIVSMSWRVLIIHIEKNYPWRNEIHKRQAIRLEQLWREFLLRNKELKEYEHHLLMLRYVTGAPIIEGSHSDINWYFFRSIDVTIAQDSKEAFVYAKLPAFLIISPLRKGKFDGMVGAKIRERGQLEFYKQDAPRSIFDFLSDRSRQALSTNAKISEKQRQSIIADYEKNKDKIGSSYGYQLYLAKMRHKKGMI